MGAGFGVGVAVGIVGIETLSTPEAGAFGDALGAVGSSSVIVWQPARTRAAAAIPYAIRFIKTPCLEFT